MALINGTALDDFLVAGADTLMALGGNDVVLVAANVDHTAKIDGGAGYARLWFSASVPDTLVLLAVDVGIEVIQAANAVGDSSGTAAVAINAAAFTTAVSLFGNAGTNTLTGGKGADTIVGGAGLDSSVGGLGTDRIFMSVVAADVDQIDAGKLTELNTLNLVGAPTGVVEIDLTRTDGNDLLLTAGDDQLLEINNVAEGVIQSGFTNVDA